MLEAFRNLVTRSMWTIARTKDSDTKKFVATSHALSISVKTKPDFQLG